MMKVSSRATMGTPCRVWHHLSFCPRGRLRRSTQMDESTGRLNLVLEALVSRVCGLHLRKSAFICGLLDLVSFAC